MFLVSKWIGASISMSPQNFLSPIEQKLLLGIAFLLCCLFFINLAEKTIAHYNEAVKNEQIERRDLANRNERISFSGCNPCKGTSIYEFILALQFLTVPLLFLPLLKRGLRLFFFSTFLTSFTLLGFISWMYYSYHYRKMEEVFRISDTTFNTYLFFGSTFLEFIIFIILSILFVLQISILTRFVIEKFQAKILS